MHSVSIIIPMRNAEAWIDATLRSVLVQLDELDVIVVDDGSSDRSVAVVQAVADPRIRVIAGPRRGIAAAFNAGLAAAGGAYACRCDADDLYPRGRLADQRAFLDANSEFGAVCGSYTTVDPSGRRVADHFAELPPGDVTDEILRGTSRSHMCAYLFRTAVLRQIGGCREWFVTSEDADLQYRLAEVTRIAFDPRCAYLYRLHDASITHAQRSAQRKFYESEARRFLEQRRCGQLDDLQRNAPPTVPAHDPGHSSLSTDQQIQELLLGQAWREHAGGRRRQSVATGWRAVRSRPGSLKAWRSLVALMIKPSSRKIHTQA